MSVKHWQHRLDAVAKAVGDTNDDRSHTAMEWATTGERRRICAALMFRLCTDRAATEAEVHDLISSRVFGTLAGDVVFWEAWAGWARVRGDVGRLRCFEFSAACARKRQAATEELTERYVREALEQGDEERAERLRVARAAERREEEARRVLARRTFPIPGGGGGGGLTTNVMGGAMPVEAVMPAACAGVIEHDGRAGAGVRVVEERTVTRGAVF